MFKFTDGFDWVKRSCALWTVQLGIITAAVVVVIVVILKWLSK